MLKKLLFVLMVTFASNVPSADQPEDLVLGMYSIISEEGDTVLGTWWNMHHIGLEATGLDANSYCDLFRAWNTKFFSTNTRGCVNSGFNKLPAGIPWNVIVPLPKIIAGDGVKVALVKEPDGSFTPRSMSQEEDGRVESMAIEREMLVSQVNELENELQNASYTIGENESEIRGLKLVAALYRQADESAALRITYWNIVGWIAVLIIIVALITSSQFRTKHESKKLRTKLAGAMNDNGELTEELTQVVLKELRLRQAIERTNVLLELPSDLVQVDGHDVYLPILSFADEDVSKIPVVWLAGAVNGTLFANHKKVWKHLSGDGEAAEKSRRWLRIEKRVVPIGDNANAA